MEVKVAKSKSEDKKSVADPDITKKEIEASISTKKTQQIDILSSKESVGKGPKMCSESISQKFI